MSAYARHQELIRNFHRYHLNAKVPASGAVEAKGLLGQTNLTDDEALRRRHRFVRDEEEDRKAYQARGVEGAAADPTAWEVRMAAKYYKLLFKEYALADLSRYREDKVGLRWRTEKDVVSGKGQFECGALRCLERRDLHSYELNFKYKEDGVVKNELVKVRVCPQCARKLYRKKIEELRAQRQREQELADRERRRRVKAGLPPNDHDPATSTGPQTPQSNSPAEPTSASEDEGHALVRQAMQAAAAAAGKTRPSSSGGDNSGDSALSSGKRRRQSRWGGRVNDDVGVDGGAEGGVRSGGGGSGASGGAREKEEEADAAAAATGSEGTGVNSAAMATRKAWAGELERDRTAEDEMDDYLSALLL